jgi:hypothetical protein
MDLLPLRQDRFAVGDEVYYHIPTVMAGCINWAPPLDAVAKIIAVRDVPRTLDGKIAGTHTQIVRVPALTTALTATSFTALGSFRWGLKVTTTQLFGKQRD